MRMLRVIGSLDPADGGPSQGLRLSAAALAEAGCLTEVATVDDPGSGWLGACDFRVHAFGGRSNAYSRSPALLRWLRANVANYDVVIQHGLWNYTAFATARSLVGARTPYFVFTHGMLDPWFRTAKPLKHAVKQASWLVSEGPLLSGARAALFTSEEERRASRQAFFPYHLVEEVVAYGVKEPCGEPEVERAAFLRALPRIEGRRFLLFLGRLHPKKGCDLLIRAFARCAAAHPQIDLVMAGPDSIGWRRALAAMTAELGVAARVHWPGMLMNEAKAGAFRLCEAFALPSHQENFGIAVAEALSYGKPTLITRKVNIWREIADAGAGFAADDDQVGVDRLIEDYLTDAEFRAKAPQAALDLFRARFEIKRAAASLLATVSRYL
jgi:glycosyltransferase involved in cell wall biosynthesis